MQNPIHICTYFDYNFLPRGMALYHSVKRYHSNFLFYALVFDTESFEYLENLHYENLIPISFETYNSYFNTSPDKFDDRKQYYFTATPNICIYILEKYPSVDVLLYLDADVYLFNSLEPLYNEFGDYSIGICPHRLHPITRKLTKNHGIYNVGVNLFRNSDAGKKCLYDWKLDCETWYKGKPGYHLEYFSDQIFLDTWPVKYSELKIIQNVGVDVAPWNAANYSFDKMGDKYVVNGVPLIIYHFSALKKIAENTWNGNTVIYLASIKLTLLEIYKKYIEEIETFRYCNAAEIKLQRNIGKRVFYSIVRLFLNETILIKK